jgi:hypothetical protein
MRHKNHKSNLLDLTVNEVSNLWSSFQMNSMTQRLTEYFIATTEDSRIKSVIEKILDQSKKNVNGLKEIFVQEHLKVPLGFTDEDVNVDCDKVFSDTFHLYFCYDITHLFMSTYPMALSDCTKNHIREHFQKNIDFAMKIQNEIVHLLQELGVYLMPPRVNIDSDVELADNLLYLNGFFGGSRPLNAPEIANLSRIILRAQFSVMVFVAFSKLAKNKELKQHFGKGRDEIEKVLKSLKEVLDHENIPISASSDYQFLDTAQSPFSDKLMLFFVNTCLGIFCFAMITQAMTSSVRTDIVNRLDKISNGMKKFYELGLLLAIRENWFEQPPQTFNRKV